MKSISGIWNRGYHYCDLPFVVLFKSYIWGFLGVTGSENYGSPFPVFGCSWSAWASRVQVARDSPGIPEVAPAVALQSMHAHTSRDRRLLATVLRSFIHPFFVLHPLLSPSFSIHFFLPFPLASAFPLFPFRSHFASACADCWRERLRSTPAFSTS